MRRDTHNDNNNNITLDSCYLPCVSRVARAVQCLAVCRADETRRVTHVSNWEARRRTDNAYRRAFRVEMGSHAVATSFPAKSQDSELATTRNRIITVLCCTRTRPRRRRQNKRNNNDINDDRYYYVHLPTHLKWVLHCTSVTHVRPWSSRA